jgi:hypothetical protein
MKWSADGFLIYMIPISVATNLCAFKNDICWETKNLASCNVGVAARFLKGRAGNKDESEKRWKVITNTERKKF